MGSRIHLHRLLFITLSTAFVALLIEFTGQFTALWPLYGMPIIVAALTFHAAGAIVMSAIAAAMIGFHALDANVAVGDSGVIEAEIGIAVFFASGLIAGVLAQRQQNRIADLERTSVYDPLTGLYSSSYFRTRLEEEVRRRARYEGDLSLLLFDLDDYEEFKDTFGTRRGDLLLEHLAEVTKIAVRSTDVLARHDNGTFALICPYCDAADAAEIARRLTELIESTEFEGDELEPVTMHTVSFGVATCPEPACDAVDLLGIAEAALRESRGGKSDYVATAAPVQAAQTGEA